MLLSEMYVSSGGTWVLVPGADSSSGADFGAILTLDETGPLPALLVDMTLGNGNFPAPIDMFARNVSGAPATQIDWVKANLRNVYESGGYAVFQITDMMQFAQGPSGTHFRTGTYQCWISGLPVSTTLDVVGEA